MRQGQVIRHAGFDGQYGVIRLFSREELLRKPMVGLLFDVPDETLEKDGARHLTEQNEKSHLQLEASSPPRISNFSHISKSPECAAVVATNILDQLDPQQRSAAECIHGPLLIVAGPGTGKTRTLTHRLAHLIVAHNADPGQCLALTFSRRAAADMIERLEKLLPDKGACLPVMTFHALGLTILKEHGTRLGLKDSMRVAGQAERAELLCKALCLTPRAANQALQKISQIKRQALSTDCSNNSSEKELLQVYQQEMRLRNWLDFDDLILLPLELLRNNSDIVELYRSRYRWVSVDEFQDVDRAQYELIKLLVPPEGNICAIGDPDQAIYGFRGSDVHCFLQFTADFPSARTIVLTRNYRSTQTIVDASLQMIAPVSLVSDRRLEASETEAARVEIHACASDRAEAEFVAGTIERLLGGSTFFSLDSRRVADCDETSFSFADFAVLYRTESQADAIVQALERTGMPFQRFSHNYLAELPAVQNILRLMAEQETEGPTSCSVLELLEQCLSKTGDVEQIAPCLLQSLRSLAAEHENDLQQFFCRLFLGVDADLWDPRADRISLLTLHGAKGLEFPVVFLTGCEDGLLPLHWGTTDQQSLAEERRLFFVGMTRARRQLFLTHADKRLLKGTLRQSTRSPFLDDIEQRLLRLHQHRAVKKPTRRDTQPTLFDC
ncbi:MAG: UvrD-helicase domain-containing protein, partial [Thermoguttaceae bacterium]